MHTHCIRCACGYMYVRAVWAFAKLAHYDGPLMNKFAAEAARRIDEFR